MFSRLADDFFETKREWSRWKHRLLKRYLGTFAGIVGSTHQDVYYVDGFAGEGRYKQPAEDGSPVIAAKLAADESVKKRYALHCINVEPEHYAALCQATAEFPPTVVNNLEGTFREHLDAILKETGDSPALFFLDPMGHVGMEWEVVSQLAARARYAITDVMLNFYVTRIDLHAGYVHSTEPQAKAFVQGLDDLFGTDEWQTIYENATSKEERMSLLTNLYIGRLLRAFKQASPSSVAARYSVRTIDGALKYHIVFGTRHPRGGRAMSDAVFRVHFEYETARVDTRNAQSAATGQRSLFGPEKPPDREEIDPQIVAELARDIRETAPLNRPLSLDDLEDLMLARWFGRAIKTHYRKACITLIEGGFATVPYRANRRSAMTTNDRITLKSR